MPANKKKYPWVLMVGNPVNGMHFVGTFDTPQEANEYAEADQFIRNTDWWTAKVHQPSPFPKFGGTTASDSDEYAITVKFTRSRANDAELLKLEGLDLTPKEYVSQFCRELQACYDCMDCGLPGDFDVESIEIAGEVLEV